MVQFLTSPAATLILLLAVTAMLIAVGVYLIGKVRQDVTSDTPGASDLISKFRDLHSRGGLSDEEYRTIKAMLAKQLDSELGGLRTSGKVTTSETGQAGGAGGGGQRPHSAVAPDRTQSPQQS